jgi:hypothetical protein
MIIYVSICQKLKINGFSNSFQNFQKKRDSEKELWRRSWESQASLHSNNTTNTSGTGNGNNQFWADYNYIMNTNLIDSCHEESGFVAVHENASNEMTSLDGGLKVCFFFKFSNGFLTD